MFFTEIGLTQYEMHDNFNPLEEYNRDMRTITTTTTVAAGRVDVVEQESKDRDEALQNAIDTNHNNIVDIENEISDLKAKDVELEGKVELNAQDIATLQVTTSSISAQLLSHIETSTSFASGILTEVKDNYTELKTDIMADRERLAVAETAIANIEQGDTEIAGRVTMLEADNEQNKEAIEALQLVDQSQGESIQDLHTRMTTAEGDISTLEARSLEVNDRLTTAEQNIEDLQNVGDFDIRCDILNETGPGVWSVLTQNVADVKLMTKNNIVYDFIVSNNSSDNVERFQALGIKTPNSISIKGGRFFVANSKMAFEISKSEYLVGTQKYYLIKNNSTSSVAVDAFWSDNSMIVAGVEKK